VAGSDTFRGITFQAAYAVGLALDVLEGKGEILVLEGSEDVVDAGILAADREPILTVQAKTKVEPHSWAPGELAGVLRSWLATGPPVTSRFEFASDGALGPGVVEHLRPALLRMREGILGPEDQAYLRKHNLDSANKALGRVTIKTRLPGGRELLEQATLRFLTLYERVGQMRVEEARDVIFRLFGETVLNSGERTAEGRELSRGQIAGLVGIPVKAIDAAEAWSEEVEARYREALKEAPPGPAWTLLNLLEAERPAALALVKSEEGDGQGRKPRSALDLLDLGQNLSLVGSAGSGKTTTLAQLRAAASERGLLPISLRLPSYDGRLEQALARSLEAVLAAPLAPGVATSLLGREDVVITIDAVTELVPEQRRALLEDIARLEAGGAKARFIFAGRVAGAFSSIETRTYSLVGLQPDTRREIAASLIEDSEDTVGDIEEHLGDLADNPLLFTMALALHEHGVRPSSRTEVFEGFLAGLEHREEGVHLSFVGRACLQMACHDLIGQGRYSAEEWWWVQRFSEARRELIDRGTVTDESPAAADLFEEARQVGLMQAIDGTPEIGLLHDLFCDWLAAGGIRGDHRVLPDPVPPSYEEVAVLLCEAGEMTEAQILAVAASITAASRVADTMPAAPIDLALADRIWKRLAAQYGEDLASHLGALHLHCETNSPTIVYLSAGGQDADHEPSLMRHSHAYRRARPLLSRSPSISGWPPFALS
jgi:hypothetical protein